ncbi:MAG: hydroxymethylbilane synthase [Candidatus Margulisiibacteriota bacterium]|nr:MAG: hydroxymethylbilane synthase [Candidatus Margulisbacteria bacterium GWD2_39_127]OGI05274.1 MAG: hydroxymethylbilane synthase [Candidatus Margulisbacteria bacterium GWF2_38_17]OGI10867.1 MAG: hydroxymethylbilane synthase [Candidatus Margulisbacteria bacterium GWE2_39_32]PZM83555.1 MAG: hydroxymethylbilane synthase [Candidatus Margulisiibacteriota bacterium]HAR64267.1 hydroxymethylbilane synthase [Candidatus Margulisiibacteriota bacterium]
MKHLLKIGTRGSALALRQTQIIEGLLHPCNPDLEIKKIIITTSGDRDKTTPLNQIGGKGIFIKELEQALLTGEIDCAIHCFKDITAAMHPSLELCAFLPPESSADVLVSQNNRRLIDLPAGSRIATSSMRRKILAERIRPDINTVEVRGNVDTRLKKIDNNEFEGIILSEAGLIRLGMQARVAERFNQDEFPPAPGQGVLAIQARKVDTLNKDILTAINDREQELKSRMEMRFLEIVGFDCNVPLGLFTTTNEESITMKGFISDISGSRFHESFITGAKSHSIMLAEELGRRFLSWRKNLS